MLKFYDSQNQSCITTEVIGSGGEGTVYVCENSDLVAKIYHEPMTDEKAEKLRWMAAHKNDQLSKIAAWVVDVLRDAPDGKVVGFLMPNIKAKEIHELYSLKSRRIYFPEATWHFLVHTAANLARAFYILHKNSHIMGDINHGNCVVLADGTVKLIDCDSYSIKTDKTRYTCEVGVATHLAPELQGVNLRAVERLEKHDNFGLAVIIFQLLFLGRHPFAGNYSGEQDKSLEDCIREYRFAYGDHAALKDVRQPPGTLSLSALSPRVAQLFERAFLTDDRPAPREWIEALEDLERNLEQCALHPGHLYFNRLAECPWCEIEIKTGLMLFPFITSSNELEGAKSFNVFTVENLLASFDTSPNLPAKPPQLPATLPPPTAEVIKSNKLNRKRMLIAFAAQFFGLIFLIAVFGCGMAIFAGIFAMLFWIIFTGINTKHLRDNLQDALWFTDQQWKDFENEWNRQTASHNLKDDLFKIRNKLGQYQKFQQTNVKKLKILRADVTRRRLHEYLHAARLDEAAIPGIEDEERRDLIKKGVTTAAEIQENRLVNFNNVNGNLLTNLLEWRGTLEEKFVVETKDDLFKTEQTTFINETLRERRRLEREIEGLLASIRAGAVYFRRQQQQLVSKAAELANQVVQTRSDAESVGDGSAAIIGLILITFITPYFGFIIGQVNAPKPAQVINAGNREGFGSRSGSGVIAAPVGEIDEDYDGKNLIVPDQYLTDEKIAAMTQDDRTYYTDNLYYQAYQLLYTVKNYQKAEQKLRLALRLKKNDPRLLNRLGYALYKQARSDESLVYLRDSLKINEDDNETKLLIGINYLQMKEFAAARQIFSEVVDKNPNSPEGFFDLGLAYKNLKNYDSAIAAFRQAVKINPDDAEAHYQLGLCFSKLGNAEAARGEYETLLEKNKETAKKLQNDANLD